jgi:chromosome segregation ATPase
LHASGVATKEDLAAENKLLGTIISDLKRKCAVQHSKICALEKTKTDLEKALLDLHDEVKQYASCRIAAEKLKTANERQARALSLLKSSEADARRTASLHEKRLTEAQQKYFAEADTARRLAQSKDELIAERQWRLVDTVRLLEAENVILRTALHEIESEFSEKRINERVQWMRAQLAELERQAPPQLEKSYGLLRIELQHYHTELRESDAKIAAERDKRINLEISLRDARVDQEEAARAVKIALERVSFLEKTHARDVALVRALESEKARLAAEAKRWRHFALDLEGTLASQGGQHPSATAHRHRGSRGGPSNMEDNSDESSVWTEEMLRMEEHPEPLSDDDGHDMNNTSRHVHQRRDS